MANQNTYVPGGKELIDPIKLLEKLGVEEGMKIADLGCGRRGYFSLQAAKLVGSGGLVYAVDVLKSALENVRSMANLFGIPNIKTVWADLEVYAGTKIPNESVDVAMINNVFFQTEKDDLILKETSRILKNGGKLLVTEWKRIKTPIGPLLENKADPQQIKNDAAKCGFVLENEFEAGPYHYGLIFVKSKRGRD